MADGIIVIEAGGSAVDRGTSIGKAVAESVHQAVVTQSEFSEALELFQGTDYLKAIRTAATDAYPEDREAFYLELSRGLAVPSRNHAAPFG
jgi:hypothetical protein